MLITPRASNAEFKTEWNCTSTPPHVLMAAQEQIFLYLSQSIFQSGKKIVCAKTLLANLIVVCCGLHQATAHLQNTRYLSPVHMLSIAYSPHIFISRRYL